MTAPGRAERPFEWAPRPTVPSTGWRWAKWSALVGYVVLVVAMFLAPDQASRIFWNALVPLLPAVFLVNVELWRNVCPLATLNTVRAPDRGAHPLSKQAVRIASVVGITTLLLCIPLRKVLLNGDGVATGVVLAAVGLMALASGLRFQNKAGFCNSVCPILPVERLYGSRPMVVVENARCTPCKGCTRSGCIDLGTERAMLQVLGESAATRRWGLTPFGAFSLAFPGVVAAFYLMPTTSPTLSASGLVAGGFASWAALSLIVVGGRFHPTPALVWVGGFAAGLYYWFTPATTAEAFAMSDTSVVVLRVIGLTLVTVWLIRGARSSMLPAVPPTAIRR